MQLNPLRQTDKRFLKNTFSSWPPGLYSPANSFASGQIDKQYAEEIMGASIRRAAALPFGLDPVGDDESGCRARHAVHRGFMDR
jgi:hypothetical protein